MKLLTSISRYLIISLLGALSFVFIRFTEYAMSDATQLHTDGNTFLWKYSIHYDLFFAIKFSILCLPLFLVTQLFDRTQRFGILLYKVLWSVLLILTTLLTYFFLASHYLLSEVIFQYSWEELMHIIRIDSNAGSGRFWILYLLIPLGIGTLFLVPISLVKTKKWILITLSCIYLLSVLIISKNWKKDGKALSHFESQYAYFLGTCKANYFLTSCIVASKENKNVSSKELKRAIVSYQNDISNRKFTSIEYPLVHEAEFSNVLGPYFKKSAKKPNIVFIISEGLSAGFSGLHPTSQSITPFIDSLAKNGLYWSNFLSNCNRTFGVLSNTLGSLPNGTKERGFQNFDGTNYYVNQYPNHKSLLTELKGNGYHSSFLYGGWSYFDNMKSFMLQQNVDDFIDQFGFDSTKYLAPWKRKPKGLCWGYDDYSLVNQWLDHSKKIKTPYISTLLTLTMHDPYNLTPKRYTTKSFIQKRLKRMHLEKSQYSTSNPLILASIFYYEDAVKELIYRYRKRADYENTIFILFGDHFSFVSYLNNPLDIYHIPFIIYSPLIKKPKQFNAVSTHLDIAPSLVALLKGNYNMKFDNKTHYLGTGLDTSSVFQSSKVVPFNPYNKSSYPYYLFGKYIVNEEGVFEILKDLKVRKVFSKSIIKRVTEHLKNYKIIDRYVCEKNKLWR